MNVSPDLLRKAFKKYESIIRASEVDCIFVSGSVARDQFYPSWSDIDVVVIAPTLSLEVTEAISSWREEVFAYVRCKVGMDYINSSRISRCATQTDGQKHILSHNFHYLANFHEDNVEQLQTGLIYQRNGYSVPQIPGSAFQNIDITDHFYDLQERVYEALMRSAVGRHDIDTRHGLRMTIKSSLYFMQDSLLIRTGKLVANYHDLPAACKDIFDVDTSVVVEVYDKLRSGKLDLSSDHDYAYIVRALKCYQELNLAAQL